MDIESVLPSSRSGNKLEVVICLVSCPSKSVAVDLARTLVARKVAACVSICPGIESIYEWEGEMTSAQEVLLLIKTTKTQVATLKTTISEEHPYEVPELLISAAVDGLPDYLEWVRKATSFGS